jgi:hypothetical protein
MQSYARSELQASSSKPQASHKLQALNQNLPVQVLKSLKQQAPRIAILYELQASGIKATSFKLHDHGPLKKFQGPLTEVPC